MNEQLIKEILIALKENEVPFKIATLHNGTTSRAVIMLPGTWADYGYCVNCGWLLELCQCATGVMVH